jgi:uncharacterized protein YdhG (YjbR/CyaY superfamily)
MMKQYKTIGEYIESYPPGVQKTLRELRATIKALAPKATEAISYGMPTFKLNGNLVHFAAYKTHIGFYPGSSGVRMFTKELSRYDTDKGTIRFSLDKPLPLPLIRKIVKFRIKENSK